MEYCPDCGIEAVSADFAPTKWDATEQTWITRNWHTTVETTCLVAAWDDDGEIFRQDD